MGQYCLRTCKVLNALKGLVLWTILNTLLLGIRATCNGWTGYDQHCYTFSTDTYNYTGAETLCNSYGANLTTVNSPEEQLFLMEHLEKNAEYWIGLYVDRAEECFLPCTNSLWQWKDGTPTGLFWNWDKDEPHSGEKCVRMGLGYQLKWRAKFCHEGLYKVICKKDEYTDVSSSSSSTSTSSSSTISSSISSTSPSNSQSSSTSSSSSSTSSISPPSSTSSSFMESSTDADKNNTVWTGESTDGESSAQIYTSLWWLVTGVAAFGVGFAGTIIMIVVIVLKKSRINKSQDNDMSNTL